MKNRIFLLLAILIYCENSYAQQIEGYILDASSGDGVVNASLRLESTGIETFSGPDGEFSFPGVDFPVWIQVNAPGYQSSRVRVREATQGLKIYLSPLAEMLSEVIVRGGLISEKYQEMATSVNVLSKTDLARTDPTNFVGILNSVPGIYVHQGALNTNKLAIRGVGARSQYSSNRIKAYFEGIPISTAEGETTLDDLDLGSIDRVEVIKGPNSSIYGAGLGGVISISAGRADEWGTSAKVETEVGSHNLLRQNVSLQHLSANTNLFASYSHLETDSFRDNGGYDRKSFNLFGKTNADGPVSFAMFANFTRLFAYIPSSISADQMAADPTSAAFTWEAAKGYESYDKGLLGVSMESKVSSKLTNRTSIYVNFRDAYEPRPFDILKEDQMATGFRTNFNFNAPVFRLPSEFSLGGEYYREWYDSATFENLYENFPGQGSVQGIHLSDNSQIRSYYNLFGQWNLDLTERLRLETGININGTSYELSDLFLEDGVDQTGNYDFETIISPRLAVLYSLTSGKALFASVSHGFSTPTVAETLTPEGLINVNLQPESGINYEVGLKANWLNRQLYSEISLYSIQVADLLVAERVAEDRYIGRNAGKTDHNGVEILLRSDVQVFENISLKPYLNAAFNFFKFDTFIDDGMDHSGNDLPGVPENTIQAGIDIITQYGLNFHAGYYRSGRIALNDANTEFTGKYELLDLKAIYERSLFKKLDLRLTGGINNLFNEEYASSILPNAVGFGGAQPRYFYPGPPRNYYVGAGLHFSL